MPQLFLITGAISCLLSVVLGAFAAHALKAILESSSLESFQVAVDYQMSQGLALIIIAVLVARFSDTKLLLGSGTLILLGALLFCGSIYVLSLTSLRYLGPINIGLITPIGGSLMIIGWICLVITTITQVKL